jgi:hypothetical protein
VTHVVSGINIWTTHIGSLIYVVIVKMTTLLALSATECKILTIVFLQQIVKKLSARDVLTGTGHIVVSVAIGMQIAVMMSVMTLIVMVSTTIHSNPHRYSITHQRNQVRLSLASS